MKKLLFPVSLLIVAFIVLPSWAAPRAARVGGRRGLRPRPFVRRPTIIAPRVIERPLIVPAPIRPLQNVEPTIAAPPGQPRKVSQIGIAGGYFGGIPAVVGEVRWFEPWGLSSTSLRLGAAYAQGNDPNSITRKHALVMVDGIYHLNPVNTPGVNPYLGAGVNYDAYTTGRVSGSIGGEVYFGLEAGTLDSGQVFLELGYGKIRTGFGPSTSGVNLTAGFRF